MRYSSLEKCLRLVTDRTFDKPYSSRSKALFHVNEQARANPRRKPEAKYLVGGSQQEAEYARFNTVYLISQYLCWAEILRREVLLLEPLHRGRDRNIVMAMESVRHDMA